MSSGNYSKKQSQHSDYPSQGEPPFPPPAPLAINSFASPTARSLIYGGPLDHSADDCTHAQNEKVAVRTVRFAEPLSIPDRGHSSSRKGTVKMDPFEVRIRFTQHLQHLNASVTSANKAAQYALKYRDMDEDLHSCILEQLEKNSMNNRANIMYFIEHLCDMASRENHHDYVRMIQRDIFRVVDSVAPEDGSGGANVKIVRKVLNALQEKSFLLSQTVSEIDEYLKERETLPDTLGLSSPLDGDIEMTDAATPKLASKNNGIIQKFDKKQVEQRIEEDRERHKRLRETIWAVPNVGLGPGRTPQQVAGDDLEFDKLLEETSELGEDDEDLYAEESDDRKAAADDWKEEQKAKAIGGGAD